MKPLLLIVGLGRELGVALWVRWRVTLSVWLRTSLKVGLTLQLWSLSSSSSSSSGLPLGSVVEDVQAAAAGENDVSNEFGAFSADVSQRAAVSVQVGELLLHRVAGQAAQGPAEGQGGLERF